MACCQNVAEGLGFEPRRRSRAQRFSRPPPSTTRPSLRVGRRRPFIVHRAVVPVPQGPPGLAAPRAPVTTRNSARAGAGATIRARLASSSVTRCWSRARARSTGLPVPGSMGGNRRIQQQTQDVRVERNDHRLLLAVSKRPQRLKRTCRLPRGAGHLPQIRHDLAERVVFEPGERRDQESAHRPLSARIP